MNSRPKRRAVATQSPNPLDNTQCTDASMQPSQPSVGESMISDAASDALEHPNFSDDYTDSSDEVEDEERSVNTDTGTTTMATEFWLCDRHVGIWLLLK